MIDQDVGWLAMGLVGNGVIQAAFSGSTMSWREDRSTCLLPCIAPGGSVKVSVTSLSKHGGLCELT